MAIGAIKPQRRGSLKSGVAEEPTSDGFPEWSLDQRFSAGYARRPRLSALQRALEFGEPSLTPQLEARNLTLILGRGPGMEKMITKNHSYRHYYYCGPLSGWRDGRAMGCRELIN